MQLIQFCLAVSNQFLSLSLALFMINSPKVTKELAPALRVVMSGAAPIGQHDVERFLAK